MHCITANDMKGENLFKRLFARIELQLLMIITAKGLRVPAINILTHSNTEALRCYAEFTRNNLSDDVSTEVLQRMNTMAYRTGRLLRVLFLVRTQEAARQLVVKLYRNIGISMSFQSEDLIYFNSCYFSHFYTPNICMAASSLDDGFIRGITGCGRLSFKQRITENCEYCIAQHKYEEKSYCNR